MKRIVISAIYVGSGFAASLAVIALITRFALPDERVGFFLFQAVFFPLTSLLGQVRILSTYRALSLGRLSFGIDVLVVLLALAALFVFGNGRFGALEAVLYAGSIPLTYHASALLAAAQFRGGGLRGAHLPILAGAAKVIVCAVALDFGPAGAFFLAAAAFLAVPLALARRTEAASAGRANDRLISGGEILALMGFAFVSGISFQWDRVVFAQIGSDALIVVTGVCMTWALSPLSMIFATLYRADARKIFASDSTSFDLRRWGRQAAVFVVLSAVYAAFTYVAWRPVNAAVFPFFEGPVIWPLILMAAIVLDRLGHLAVYSTPGGGYGHIAMIKPIIMAVAITLASLSHDVSLLGVYVLYLLSAALYLGIALFFAARASRRSLR
ncbi:hypothetical protein [Oceanibium sediminis]|uniref:hypothetical protein n=1 Tax=Oceanibium sediminis TaxID=2026339 RepID=UPI000DD2FB95|nr:hypothetical protein [Oceanibium sediminis]